jgi:adenylate kinase family enzyme
MDTLETYLTGDYHRDRSDIQDIEELLKSVALSFADKFEPTRAWPYAIHADGSGFRPGDRLSQSTTAMILGALMRLRGHLPPHADEIGPQVPQRSISRVPIGEQLEAKLDDQIQTAATELLNNVLGGEALELKTNSNTFGENDIFTLAWLAELTREGDPTKIVKDPRWPSLSEHVFRSAEAKARLWVNTETPPHFYDPPKETKADPLRHVFPALRLVQSIRRTKGRDYGALAERYQFFETNLHDQLSYSSIPDSRFDPAELMFCLEGMLLCQQNVVARSLFDRVLSVLTEAQNENAYWRPVKPYLATEQGLVLFPVSVEVANSLLRSCFIVDGERLHDTYISKCIGLLRRYWQWLKARTVRFKSGLELVGWHSEHVNAPTVIHMWETSQVVEFLLAYRMALKLHIARTTLVRSRFKSDSYPYLKWKIVEEENEPVTILGPGLQVYKGIGEAFIDRKGAAASYSMLLYGPPGTGKSTIAKNIAGALGRRLITITVSDFLAEGGEQLEARAKNIFTVLTAQSNCVVLFDEIDHFLLDRDSDRYSEQDTVFQFMTPGMLTKLNDLRHANDAIFIIATNYEDRIDAAIKRTGRIDKQYLVLPPDNRARQSLISKGIGGNTLNDGITWKDLQVASLFLGVADIKTVINQWRQKGDSSHKVLKRMLQDAARTVSLYAYASRFERKGEPLDVRETPMSEFLSLVALQIEAEIAPDDREKAAIKKAVRVLSKHAATPGERQITKERIKEVIRELDPTQSQEIASRLNRNA